MRGFPSQSFGIDLLLFLSWQHLLDPRKSVVQCLALIISPSLFLYCVFSFTLSHLIRCQLLSSSFLKKVWNAHSHKQSDIRHGDSANHRHPSHFPPFFLTIFSLALSLLLSFSTTTTTGRARKREEQTRTKRNEKKNVRKFSPNLGLPTGTTFSATNRTRRGHS